jgi:ERCC4-type nuclease
MILVSSAVGSRELRQPLEQLGHGVESTSIHYGDACFEGYGPEGLDAIGIERKRLRDMLTCIGDGRYNAQRVGMEKMYAFSFLILEGVWAPNPHGVLYRGIEDKQGGIFWTPNWGEGMGIQMYAKLRRYLFSVSLSGVHVLYTRNLYQTAYDIHELFHYFQKPWRDHKSMLALHQRTVTIPTLNHRASLVRRWAFELEGVGMEKSADAERLFRTPRELANAEESQWMKIPGVGAHTAIDIVKQIGGYSR